MLVLSRKPNQKIDIGPDITLTVVEIRGDKVRIGIEAPANTPVFRREIFDEIMKSVDDVDASTRRWTPEQVREIMRRIDNRPMEMP